jgi:glycosyltransferase involved in cell wall biosynthesis
MIEQEASPVFDLYVSVVIPVYNDAAALKLCLDALEKQTYPKKSFEVIVVDNNSDDRIDPLVEEYARTVLTYEKQPGSYAARNKGLSIARGDIIAFTDSDCIPAADWIEKGVSNFLQTDNCGLVAGKIKLMFRNADRPTPVEIYESLTAFDQKNKVESFMHGVTANLFTHRSVFARVGIFNPELKSGGDVEWGKRVYHYGYKQIYAVDCCVQHPARRTLAQLFKKVTRVEGGTYNWKYKNGYSILDITQDLVKLTRKTLSLLKQFCFDTSPGEYLEHNRQKIHYLLVMVSVRLVRIFERIRLKTGRAPQR